MARRNTILIIGDVGTERKRIREIFEKSHHLLEAETVRDGLNAIRLNQADIAVILLDIVQNEEERYRCMSKIRERGYLTDIPVILLTDEESVGRNLRVFELGVSEVIVKPYAYYIVKRRVQNIIELSRQKRDQEEIVRSQLMKKIREANSVMLTMLTSMIEWRSVETSQHIRRIRTFTKILLHDVARQNPEYLLNDLQIGIIVDASTLHDIGKIAIPDAVLNKPESLTAEEFMLMKSHVTRGCEMLSSLSDINDKEYMRFAYNICRYHHERWDGMGYPDGLKGENIPICAQVVGMADCYEALTTDRVYKKAISPDLAYHMIQDGKCGRFSPKLLQSLENVQTELLKNAANPVQEEDAEFSRRRFQTLSSAAETFNSDKMGRIKYGALLNYIDQMVLEIDFRNDAFQVSYLSDDVFGLFKEELGFRQAVENFADKRVFSADRSSFVRMLTSGVGHFYKEGLLKKSLKLRLLNSNEEKYDFYKMTLLRLRTPYVKQKKALLIFVKQHGSDAEQAKASDAINEIISNSVVDAIQICRNDTWFTMQKGTGGVQRLLGYTEEEIETEFQNRYINLILKEDRSEVVRQVERQRQYGNMFELEYRMVGKDGKIFWILEKSKILQDENGEEIFYCILIDITKSKLVQERLSNLTDRYKIVMSYTDDVIFEWDARTDQIHLSENGHKKFSYFPGGENTLKNILHSAYVHPEDKKSLQRMILDIRHGILHKEIQIRIVDEKECYCWYKIRLVAKTDGAGRIAKVVGMLNNIDEQQRALQDLKDKADRDGLTSLLNKGAAIREIQEYLRRKPGNEIAAMLVIDVDDFKQVNDKCGHLFGDSILSNVSKELKSYFRKEDVVARFGGDEFLIFMKNVRNRLNVEKRADEILKAFHSMGNENEQLGISCSIGVSFCPDDGTTYDELFRKSDFALYHAKSKSKNSFVVFRKASEEGTEVETGSQSGATTEIDIHSEEDS